MPNRLIPDLSDKKWYKEINPTNNLPYLWSYRGSFYNHISYGDLTDAQKLRMNAACIADQLFNPWWGMEFNLCPEHKGWTLLAIAGFLGNVQSECGLNPGLIERKYTDPDTGGGIGLIQSTPNRNYRKWCDSMGFQYYDMTVQFRVIAYEMSGRRLYGHGGWYETWPYSFYEYSQIEDVTPERAALVFAQNYLRPAAGVYEERQEQAKNWYEWLVENPPKKHEILTSSNWIYYMKRRCH